VVLKVPGKYWNLTKLLHTTAAGVTDVKTGRRWQPRPHHPRFADLWTIAWLAGIALAVFLLHRAAAPQPPPPASTRRRVLT
jgi:hypothetical protein